ncbi:hypothetical protein ACUY3K_07675 [Corynebacterium uberis]|nr:MULTISPECIES: hypothetical protein [Corynebacterium]
MRGVTAYRTFFNHIGQVYGTRQLGVDIPGAEVGFFLHSTVLT